MQLFHCEFYEIFKNTYVIEHLWTAASRHKEVFWKKVFFLASRPEVFCEKGVPKIFVKNLQEKNCIGVSFLTKLQC